MNARPFVAIAFAFIAAATSAQALESRSVSQIRLVCPDRSPRMTDISLAVSRGHYRATRTERNRMLERARSVCAAGLSVVSLNPSADRNLASDRSFVSDTKQ